jgi:hypothetical protein
MPAGASSTRTLWQGLSFGEAHDRSSSREGVHDELSMSAELLQGLLQVLQQFLGFRRILTFSVIRAMMAICAATRFSPSAMSRSALARSSNAFCLSGMASTIMRPIARTRHVVGAS